MVDVKGEVKSEEDKKLKSSPSAGVVKSKNDRADHSASITFGAVTGSADRPSGLQHEALDIPKTGVFDDDTDSFHEKALLEVRQTNETNRTEQQLAMMPLNPRMSLLLAAIGQGPSRVDPFLNDTQIQGRSRDLTAKWNQVLADKNKPGASSVSNARDLAWDLAKIQLDTLALNPTLKPKIDNFKQQASTIFRGEKPKNLLALRMLEQDPLFANQELLTPQQRNVLKALLAAGNPVTQIGAVKESLSCTELRRQVAKQGGDVVTPLDANDEQRDNQMIAANLSRYFANGQTDAQVAKTIYIIENKANENEAKELRERWTEATDLQNGRPHPFSPSAVPNVSPPPQAQLGNPVQQNIGNPNPVPGNPNPQLGNPNPVPGNPNPQAGNPNLQSFVASPLFKTISAYPKADLDAFEKASPKTLLDTLTPAFAGTNSPDFKLPAAQVNMTDAMAKTGLDVVKVKELYEAGLQAQIDMHASTPRLTPFKAPPIGSPHADIRGKTLAEITKLKDTDPLGTRNALYEQFKLTFSTGLPTNPVQRGLLKAQFGGNIKDGELGLLYELFDQLDKKPEVIQALNNPTSGGDWGWIGRHPILAGIGGYLAAAAYGQLADRGLDLASGQYGTPWNSRATTRRGTASDVARVASLSAPIRFLTTSGPGMLIREGAISWALNHDLARLNSYRRIHQVLDNSQVNAFKAARARGPHAELALFMDAVHARMGNPATNAGDITNAVQQDQLAWRSYRTALEDEHSQGHWESWFSPEAQRIYKKEILAAAIDNTRTGVRPIQRPDADNINRITNEVATRWGANPALHDYNTVLAHLRTQQGLAKPEGFEDTAIGQAIDRVEAAMNSDIDFAEYVANLGGGTPTITESPADHRARIQNTVRREFLENELLPMHSVAGWNAVISRLRDSQTMYSRGLRGDPLTAIPRLISDCVAAQTRAMANLGVPGVSQTPAEFFAESDPYGAARQRFLVDTLTAWRGGGVINPATVLARDFPAALTDLAARNAATGTALEQADIQRTLIDPLAESGPAANRRPGETIEGCLNRFNRNTDYGAYISGRTAPNRVIQTTNALSRYYSDYFLRNSSSLAVTVGPNDTTVGSMTAVRDAIDHEIGRVTDAGGAPLAGHDEALIVLNDLRARVDRVVDSAVTDRNGITNCTVSVARALDTPAARITNHVLTGFEYNPITHSFEQRQMTIAQRALNGMRHIARLGERGREITPDLVRRECAAAARRAGENETTVVQQMLTMPDEEVRDILVRLGTGERVSDIHTGNNVSRMYVLKWATGLGVIAAGTLWAAMPAGAAEPTVKVQPGGGFVRNSKHDSSAGQSGSGKSEQ